jgi:NADPH-dependent curcumin reductase CurA
MKSEKTDAPYSGHLSGKSTLETLQFSNGIVLAKRPHGAPIASDFRMERVLLPAFSDGDVIIRVDYISIDPYMRGRMNEGQSYVPPIAIGGVMQGEGIGTILDSKDTNFLEGDIVKGPMGWMNFVCLKTSQIQKLDPAVASVTTSLGVLGMPGLTAYGGLLNIGRPIAGETVVVAAATGPVGSMVGQIAKIKGSRTIGIAGGPTKCGFAKTELAFDEVIDHHSKDFAAQLAAACPSGIDIYFESVGGAVWQAVLPLLNDHARVPLCGLVSEYNGAIPFEDSLSATMRQILTKSINIRGFICSEFAGQFAQFHKEVLGWISEGKIKYLEDIVEGGLEKAPAALIGLLQGKNFGKLIVHL